MIKLDIYAFGSGYRVQSHHHPRPHNEPCDEQCYEYTKERTYGRKGDKPSETRGLITAAVARALNQRETSHVQFLLDAGDQTMLDL